MWRVNGKAHLLIEMPNKRSHIWLDPDVSNRYLQGVFFHLKMTEKMEVQTKKVLRESIPCSVTTFEIDIPGRHLKIER